MEFKQFYLGCLAHASYLIGSDGEAAVVDPRRDVDEYLDEARGPRPHDPLRDRDAPPRRLRERPPRARGAHGRQDRLRGEGGGHASRTGRSATATRSASATSRCASSRRPGHTPESVSVLVIDTAERARAADGAHRRHALHRRRGPARPRGRDGASSPETMAGMLYDSLHGKLLTLHDAVEVYPAHGAGSLCGRNISKETSSTIGEQRRDELRAPADAEGRLREDDDGGPARGARATSRATWR